LATVCTAARSSEANRRTDRERLMQRIQGDRLHHNVSPILHNLRVDLRESAASACQCGALTGRTRRCRSGPRKRASMPRYDAPRLLKAGRLMRTNCYDYGSL
jgi:hypothetical protein